MGKETREKWNKLHEKMRYRLKYPSETVVRFVCSNFTQDGKSRILDLGCGAGRHMAFMCNENIIPYGIDSSNNGVEYTKYILRKAGWNQYVENVEIGTATKLPYQSGFFDGIICYGVISYLDVEEIKKTIDEIYRVLKNDGKVLVVVRGIEDYRYDQKKEIVERGTIYIEESDKTKSAHSENGMITHFFEKKELGKLFSMFKAVKIDYIKESNNNEEYYDHKYVVTAVK